MEAESFSRSFKLKKFQKKKKKNNYVLFSLAYNCSIKLCSLHGENWDHNI